MLPIIFPGGALQLYAKVCPAGMVGLPVSCVCPPTHTVLLVAVIVGVALTTTVCLIESTHPACDVVTSVTLYVPAGKVDVVVDVAVGAMVVAAPGAPD